jgi:hypothetical protein
MIMRKLTLIVAGLIVAASVAAAAEPETTARVFHLRYVSVVDAMTAVQPLLSEQGSVTMQPKRSRLTVQDRPEVVELVAAVIESLDRAPIVYRIRVDLLEGIRDAAFSSPKIDVPERVKRMFGFEVYRRLGMTSFEGEVGTEASAELGMAYRVSMMPEMVGGGAAMPFGTPDLSSRLHLEWLRLERLPKEGSGGRPIEVLKTSGFLSTDQEIVIGAAGSENAPTALVLIVRAEKIGER